MFSGIASEGKSIYLSYKYVDFVRKTCTTGRKAEKENDFEFLRNET